MTVCFVRMVKIYGSWRNDSCSSGETSGVWKSNGTAFVDLERQVMDRVPPPCTYEKPRGSRLAPLPRYEGRVSGEFLSDKRTGTHGSLSGSGPYRSIKWRCLGLWTGKVFSHDTGKRLQAMWLVTRAGEQICVVFFLLHSRYCIQLCCFVTHLHPPFPYFFLLMWIHFNPTMDKSLYTLQL